jgi:hypothetical protein
MTSEFKKIKNNEDTHYVLETATAGATSSSVVATAPGKKREDSILAQEKKETPKPRNFVAKNAKMGGAGQHKDKKKAAKQGDVKHKKPLAESYAEDLAKQVFDANPNIKDENAVLDAAWPIVVQDLGKKTAMSMFNYDEDFPSDLVSVYGWLQKGTSEGVSDLSYDAQSLITKLRRDVEEKRLRPTPEAVLAAAKELAGDMEFAPQLLVKQVLGQGIAEKIDSRFRKTEWIPIADALKILKHYGATIEEWGGHFHFAYYDREGVRKRIEDLTWNADDTRNVRLSILNQAVRELKAQQQGVAEGDRTMSRAAKGHEKYGKEGMQALAKAGREGASEKKLDAIRDKHDNYNEGFNGEYDDEAGMAHNNLLTSARAVMGLLKTIEDKDNLPEWVQEKIAKAEMMLVGVWDYLQSQKEQGIDPQVEGLGRMRGSSSAYDRDYASSVSGMGRDPDHRGLGQELAHETNNYAVAIDGKTWKVFADQRQAENIARSLKAKGKNATVHPTGENPSESVAEVAPPGWEKTVKAMKKHDNIDNPFALAWSMKNKGYKSHKKESADPYFESLRAKVEELAKK